MSVLVLVLMCGGDANDAAASGGDDADDLSLAGVSAAMVSLRQTGSRSKRRIIMINMRMPDEETVLRAMLVKRMAKW